MDSGWKVYVPPLNPCSYIPIKSREHGFNSGWNPESIPTPWTSVEGFTIVFFLLVTLPFRFYLNLLLLHPCIRMLSSTLLPPTKGFLARI